MKIVLRILGALVGLVAAAAIVIFIAGRFSDGPMGFFSGAPFTSGELAESPANWSFATDTDTIELQLLEPPRARTVWIVVDDDDDGRAFIPCGRPDFRLLKQWPHEALLDGRAEIRIDGKRYPVTLVKTDDRALFEHLLEKVGDKYGGVPSDAAEVDEDAVWFFRLDPRVP